MVWHKNLGRNLSEMRRDPIVRKSSRRLAELGGSERELKPIRRKRAVRTK